MIDGVPHPFVGPAVLYCNVSWCGHCKSMRPTMETVSGILGSMVPVYSVDGDRYEVSEWGVDGFPTVLLIDEGGAMHQYTGPRTVDGVTSWVCQQVACPSRRI